MTAFADEVFYKNEYLCGKEAVINTAFDFYAKKATQHIRQHTFNNIDENDIPTCVKECCCAVAELLYNYDNSEVKQGLTSEKVGDISRSYENTSERITTLHKNIKSCIFLYLGDTGLLYRGCDNCDR